MSSDVSDEQWVRSDHGSNPIRSTLWQLRHIRFLALLRSRSSRGDRRIDYFERSPALIPAALSVDTSRIRFLTGSRKATNREQSGFHLSGRPLQRNQETLTDDEMYRGQTVAVVIPAYNEEQFIGSVIDEIPDFVDRLYAVDDCSTDGTWEAIREHATADADTKGTVTPDGGQIQSRVVPIRHETNQGVGGAIKTGYQRALQEGIDVTAVIAGDGQMDPDILDRFIDPIVEGTADYTKGNRLQAADLHSEMPAWRQLGNSLLTFLTKIASGYWKMTDPQNGYTAISLSALEALDLDVLYDRYGFSNDILVNLNAHGFRVADIPMKAVYGDEESDIRYSSFVPSLSVLLFRDFLWRLKTKYMIVDFHPLVFFYMLGTVGSLIGFLYGLSVLFLNPSLLAGGISLLILLFSSTLLVFAMVFDMQHNEDLEKQVSY